MKIYVRPFVSAAVANASFALVNIDRHPPIDEGAVVSACTLLCDALRDDVENDMMSGSIQPTTMMSNVRDALVALSVVASTPNLVVSIAQVVSAVVVGGCRTPPEFRKNHLDDDDEFYDTRAFGFAIPDVREAFVAMSKYANTSDSIEHLSRAIVSIVSCDDSTDELIVQKFATEEMRDALIAMSSDASSNDAVLWLSKAMNALTSETRNDFGEYDGKHERLMLLYSTPAMRDALLGLATRAKTNIAIEAVTRALSHIVCPKRDQSQKELFGTVAIRDALVELLSVAVECASDATMCDVIKVMCYIIRHNTQNMITYATKDVRAVLCAAARRARTDDVIRRIASAFRNITMLIEPKRMKDEHAHPALQVFINDDVRDSLLLMLTYASHGEAVARIAWTFSNIAWYFIDDADGKASFFDKGVHDALVAASLTLSYIRDNKQDQQDAAQFLLQAFGSITYGSWFTQPRVTAMFSTIDVHDALLALSPFVFVGSVIHFLKCIAYITNGCSSKLDDENKKLFDDVKKRFGAGEMRNALVDAASNVPDDNAAGYALLALQNLVSCMPVKENFATPDVYQALVAMSHFATQGRNARNMLKVVQSATYKCRPEVMKVFSTTEMLDILQVWLNAEDDEKKKGQIHLLMYSMRRCLSSP